MLRVDVAASSWAAQRAVDVRRSYVAPPGFRPPDVPGSFAGSRARRAPDASSPLLDRRLATRVAVAGVGEGAPAAPSEPVRRGRARAREPIDVPTSHRSRRLGRARRISTSRSLLLLDPNRSFESPSRYSSAPPRRPAGSRRARSRRSGDRGRACAGACATAAAARASLVRQRSAASRSRVQVRSPGHSPRTGRLVPRRAVSDTSAAGGGEREDGNHGENVRDVGVRPHWLYEPSATMAHATATPTAPAASKTVMRNEGRVAIPANGDNGREEERRDRVPARDPNETRRRRHELPVGDTLEPLPVVGRQGPGRGHEDRLEACDRRGRQRRERPATQRERHRQQCKRHDRG